MKPTARLGGTLFRLALVLTAAMGGSLAGWSATPPLPSGTQEVDRFLIVDCLLPGQVRRLGTALTYLTPRRPAKLTAEECALRGGEYVAYDRADLATALAVWLPLAEKGDPQAQTYAGELYERGVGGVAPDYARAAQWYRKAAEQGHPRARINLGFLYEKGLGVSKDPVTALNLYRQAAGIEEAVALDGTAVSAEREAQLEALRRELDDTRRQLEEAQERLRRQQSEHRSEQERLQRERDEARASGSAAERARVAELEARLAEREAALARQAAEAARLEQAAQRHQAELARLQAQRTEAPPAPKVALAPPSIQLIDPPVVTMRSPLTVQLRGAPAMREIVGKVTAPAGLLSFTVNDRSEQVDAQGLFKTSLQLGGEPTPVTLVAVDRRGKRAALEFTLVPEALQQAAPDKPQVPDLEFGHYHALVIGNQNYRELLSLDTAINDARAVSEVLADKYGFKVTTLTDATRYDILSALNKLRAQLTEKDNLLIYYAGHGELDRANLRAHWLPVDAELDSNANWISSVAITDIINAMSVKHVLIVADSCYSGAMTRSSIAQLQPGLSDESQVTFLKALVQARARTVLTSGGVQPVMDGGGGEHSVFARAFLEVLRENAGVLEAARLYREVAARVLLLASRFQVEQKPEYAPLKFAGHESGDFVFVPAGT